MDRWALFRRHYLPFSGEITLEYGDFEGYQTFADEAGLTALLDAAAAARQPEVKLYYNGDDPFFTIGYRLDAWFSDNKTLYASWKGTTSKHYADLSVEWK